MTFSSLQKAGSQGLLLGPPGGGNVGPRSVSLHPKQDTELAAIISTQKDRRISQWDFITDGLVVSELFYLLCLSLLISLILYCYYVQKTT